MASLKPHTRHMQQSNVPEILENYQCHVEQQYLLFKMQEMKAPIEAKFWHSVWEETLISRLYLQCAQQWRLLGQVLQFNGDVSGSEASELHRDHINKSHCNSGVEVSDFFIPPPEKNIRTSTPDKISNIIDLDSYFTSLMQDVRRCNWIHTLSYVCKTSLTTYLG